MLKYCETTLGHKPTLHKHHTSTRRRRYRSHRKSDTQVLTPVIVGVYIVQMVPYSRRT
jgi:predicted RNA-binding protein